MIFILTIIILFVIFFSVANKQMKGKKMKNRDYKNVLVTTTLDLNQDFDTIGMVTASIKNPSTDFKVVTEEIQKQAYLKKADAIIGFKAERTRSNLSRQWTQTAYGTAVKYKKHEMQG